MVLTCCGSCSIATHLACKWGQAAHDELRYLMPHRIDAAVGLSFLLHSNSNGVGGVTWTALDRLVQASDVYTDLGQVLHVWMCMFLCIFTHPAAELDARRCNRR